MTQVDLRWRVRGLVGKLRRRVRLRTRLRRVATAVRSLTRRTTRWSADQPAGVTHQGSHAEITVATPGGLWGEFDGEASSARVVVADWRPPLPGWSGRLGSLPGLLHHEVALPAGGRGTASVTVHVATPLPLTRLVEAVHPVLEPVRPLVSGARAAVSADARAANPRGRQRYGPSLPAGELRLDGAGGWSVVHTGRGTVAVAGRVGETLGDRQRHALLELGLVTLPDRPDQPQSMPAAVVAQLAMTGVVLRATPSACEHLAPELSDILTAAPPAGNDPLPWEARSVRQRRAAMRHHTTGLATPAVSALLVTKRPELAVHQVSTLAAQTYPRLEIVVAVHGDQPPPALRQAAADRPIVLRTVPAERNLGEALQVATEAASGEIVTKVDDDDHYGPEHVWDLVLAHHYSGATLVGKGAELVYVAPKEITVRRRMGAEFFTDTVAGGTLTLTRADLAAVGGWPPVPKHVDRALMDRLLGDGGAIYRTHPMGFIYTRHGDGHTWQADLDYFLHDAARQWRGLPSHDEVGAV